MDKSIYTLYINVTDLTNDSFILKDNILDELNCLNVDNAMILFSNLPQSYLLKSDLKSVFI